MRVTHTVSALSSAHLSPDHLLQFNFEILITHALFYFRKMNFPRLHRIVRVIQNFISELFTGKVKDAFANDITVLTNRRNTRE